LGWRYSWTAGLWNVSAGGDLAWALAVYSEISAAIIVAADHQNARMGSTSLADEVVKLFEVVVICRQQRPVLSDGLRAVYRIAFAGHVEIAWPYNIVSAALQEPVQQHLS
jgi:hypothetical protein